MNNLTGYTFIIMILVLSYKLYSNNIEYAQNMVNVFQLVEKEAEKAELRVATACKSNNEAVLIIDDKVYIIACILQEPEKEDDGTGNSNLPLKGNNEAGSA